MDCVHFVACVLDVLFGEDRATSLQSLLPDACVHNRIAVLQMLRQWMWTYPHNRVRDGVIEAGDVLVFKPTAKRSTASHVALVGAPGRIWHATAPQVCCTGIESVQGMELLAVYRSPHKQQWLNDRLR